MFLQDLDQHSRNYTQLTTLQFDAKYKYLGELGSGTFGSVSKVSSAQGKEFAIKEFNTNAVRNVKQIIREVDNLKRLEHPNIVRFYECYVVDKNFFRILLEYCEGGNLQNYIKNNKLNEVNRLILIQDIAEGLAFAHQQKIVHRDLKPQNIFVGKGNKAKIGDFGCSILMEDENTSMLSRLGSPAYWDQRIANGDPYDMSVDIYALGLIIFSIYKGKGMYDECQNMYSIQRQKSSIYKDYDQRMDQLTENLPYTIKMLIKNCLQQDHEKRYTAREISKLIEKEIYQKKKEMDIATKSTQQDAEIQDEETLFAIEIRKQIQYLERKQRKEYTRRKLLELFNSYKEKIETAKQLQTLKYVDPKYKQRFVALLYFYYMFWLKNIEDYLNGTSLTFEKKYHQINPEDIQLNFLESVKEIIENERKRYWKFLINCCREINPTMRLIIRDLPPNFKEMIRMGCTDKIQFDQFQDSTIREQIQTLFANQIKKEYLKNRGNDNSEDQRLKKIEDLCKNL